MRVLVLESEPGAASAAVAALEAADHVVSRCHEPGQPGFPCRALDAPGECPLVSRTVDVALTVRGEERWTTSELEDGVACAIRAGVPLVVSGAAGGNPFERWATATVPGGEVVDACEWAASAPLERHSRIATRALRESLAHNEVERAELAEVEVRRRNGGLKVVAQVPVAAPWRTSELALTRVLGALRKLDPAAAGIDVSLAPVAEE